MIWLHPRDDFQHTLQRPYRGPTEALQRPFRDKLMDMGFHLHARGASRQHGGPAPVRRVPAHGGVGEEPRPHAVAHRPPRLPIGPTRKVKVSGSCRRWG